VFLLDELDASIPETLTMLNEALANGYFPFPTGKVDAHPDFHCLAAGNTFGTGADNEYTGRYQIDAATLNRFGVIRVDYDERIERAMCDNDESLVSFAHEYRAAVKESGISSLCTYRDIKRLHKFSAYMEKPEAIQIGLTKGMPSDDCRMLYNKINDKSNVWAKALKALADM
jgi:MoxR-like ATPase